ncbi:MAG: DinB family protein [Pyrinomonadaceae bacterium]
MIPHRSAWFERHFTFDLPLWMYPNIVERVRGTPARLEDRLAALPREILTRRDGEHWSMQEQAGHLLDLGTLDLGRLDDYQAGLETLRPADLRNRKTHEAAHNENSIEDILASFRAERGEFVRRLDSFEDAFIGRRAIHPRLERPMRLVDLVYFIAEHDDHHLARITDLIRVFAV